MFVTFSCDAYENITYFENVAKQLLLLMGHRGTIPGAIKSENVLDALHHLQQGLGKIKSENKPLEDDEDSEPDISLAKRAIPLIHLLQAAEKKDCDVLWSHSKSPG
ncbi:TPA: DUF1840 family protein [Legionella pneumophila subsp. pneumophila]|uniref:DUF1840 domain-containing protein n=1 Tax=Legionella pneumophila TaxID=446 RepID=UPI000770A44F|nr:DUF1840 domain-containing protein [Legionella pneumophila]HAT9214048.1 DUF1840 family protein [Legionella pneumophila subsp. pneumophila]CZI69405.1 Domain of uncharacterised function (DUF1840) [Legionella pneumophila]HAT9261354.1 DUF1840 family protein [Legionella pneumophila subsp. pneumophila]HAT9282006.1 DUF1840 family protein [Legionella pneumophila subsp. pneumophila]HAT9287782.1 DUF1840 family protein [Legionella pneumophila subsp. pneumophila]